MKNVWAMLARRGAAGIALGITVAVLAGGSYVIAAKGTDDAPGLNRAAVAAQQDAGTEDEGVHGGTVARFHGDSETPCDTPEDVTLEGNWTHGDYVSAWAKTEDRAAHKVAAKSPCGKPQTAVDAQRGVHGKSADAPGLNKHDSRAGSHGRSGDAPGKKNRAGAGDDA